MFRECQITSRPEEEWHVTTYVPLKKPRYILTFPPIIMSLSAVTLYWFSSAFLGVKDCLGSDRQRGGAGGARGTEGVALERKYPE